MKVYVVTDGEYSAYQIEGVFDNLNEAEKYAALHQYARIEEYDTEDNKIEGDVDYYYEFKFSVDVSASTIKLIRTIYTTERKNYIEDSWYVNMIWVYVCIKEHSIEKATKIAQDMVAQYKAESEGIL